MTVPAPPKASLFKTALETPPSVRIAEDTTESQSFIILLPPEAFRHGNSQIGAQKTCSEILTVISANESLVLSSSITISEAASGCQISFIPIPNASGDLKLIATATSNPTDQLSIPVTIEPVNDPPIIPDFAIVSAAEDATSVISIPLIDDTPGLTCETAISATSSSQTLIADSNIIVSGNFPDCQLSYIPEPNQSGSAEITLMVNDGTIFTQKTFAVVITAVNDPPVISDVSNTITDEESILGGVSFSISDPDATLSCSSTHITASSSNQNLISSSSITISGTAPNCLVSLSPSFNQTGTSNISLTVHDGLLSASDTFVLTVRPINDLPTDISLSSLSLAENSGSNASIGILAAIDPDFGDAFTYTFVSGDGDTDNQFFNIFANILRKTDSADFETKSSYSIRLQVTDQGGLSFEKQFSIGITNVNEAPSDMILSNTLVVENSGVPATVGILSATDPDLGNTFTFTLVTGDGDANNQDFNIVSNELRMTGSADFETKSSYSIRLRVTDQGGLSFEKPFGISLADVNEAPSDITLSSLSVAENSGPNTTVGILSATDPDLGNNFTFTLITGDGDTNNQEFNLFSNNLRMNASADFETKSFYSIRLQATDQGGLTFEKSFTVLIGNVNEAPTLVAINDELTLEDSPKTISISPSDIDGSLSCSSTHLSYISSDTSIIAETDAIVWSGTWPTCSATITPLFNASGSVLMTVIVSDGLLTASQGFNFTVSAVNDPPVISDVANQTTIINFPLSGIAVNISDPDSNLSCGSPTLAASSSNPTLISSSNITFLEDSPNNCILGLSPSSGQIGTSTITLTVNDGILSASDMFLLTVNLSNVAPTDVSLSSLLLAENSGSNATIGILSATDADLGNTFAYSLVTGVGDSDNQYFNILSNTLRMAASADFETKSSYSIRIQVTDQGGLSFQKQFSLTITDVNEAPSVSAVANQTTNQDTPTTAIAITISDVDGPARECNATYLSYASQDPSVVAATGAVTWSGTWPNCSVVITPVTGATGSSVISVSASDGSLTGVSQNFTLQVGSASMGGNPTGWYQEAYIKASNADASDNFGFSVSISGDTAVVGAQGEDSVQNLITNGTTSAWDNTASGAGASYIYSRSGSLSTGYTWTQQAYVKASNANSGDTFGKSVSISVDTVLIGAHYESSGQSFITNGTTSSTSNLTTYAGASYIYRRSGSSGSGYTWAQEAYLKASNAGSFDYYGGSVAISGDTALVGADREASLQDFITNGTFSSANNSASNTGAAYVYRRSGSAASGYIWAQEAYLKASNANGNDYFGNCVSISGDTAIVGAFGEASNQTVVTNGTSSSNDNSGVSTGASYIFGRSGSVVEGYTWAQEAYLKASNAYYGDAFGRSVSISGDTVVVGSRNEASNQTVITNGTSASSDRSAILSGAGYIFRRSGTRASGYTWYQEAYLKASNANLSDLFSTSISVSGDTVVVGALQEDSNQTVITNGSTSSSDDTKADSGAAYIYRRTGSAVSGFIWAQEAYLKASNGDASDIFGSSVAVSGDTAVVGAYQEDSSQVFITNGTTSSLDNATLNSGAVYVYRNLSRMFEAREVRSEVTTSSFTVSWTGINLGTSDGTFKVVYSTTSPGPFCSTGTVAYIGKATSVSVNSGLMAGQNYFVRICAFDGQTYSEGTTTELTVKGDDIGPNVLTINRGSTPNPVPWGTTILDYVVTFDETVRGLKPDHFSFTEVNTTSGATGKVSSISCSEAVCTVWVIPGNSGELRLDLTSTSGVVDIWGNPSSASKIGDQTFTLPAGWVQEAYIKASNANASDYFGQSVSVSGDSAIVGSYGEDSNYTLITNDTTSSADNTAIDAGASYVYRRSGSLLSGYSWAQEAYLKASNTNASDYFGASVAISGDTAVVGAYREDSNQTFITNGTSSSTNNTAIDAGASYIYRRSNVTSGYYWAQEGYIKASNANVSDYYGASVSISGDTAVIGAYQESSNQTFITNGTTASTDSTAASAGASFIYRRSGNATSGYTWTQEAYVKASNANASDRFGWSVSVSGDTLVVGADFEDSNQIIITNDTTSSLDNTALDSGASYVYRRSGSIASGYYWAQEAYLKASNANGGDTFGRSVSISGDTVVVGADYEDSNQTIITNGTTSSLDNIAVNSGAGYIYKRSANFASGYSWQQEAYLKASNAGGSDFFGRNVSISGDTAVVGACLESSNQTFITNGTTSSSDNTVIQAGAAYIYKRSGSAASGYNWSQEAYLKASNATGMQGFCRSISLSGDTAVVGADYESSSQTFITNGPTSSRDTSAYRAGAVYVYRNLSRMFDPDLRVSARTETSITLSWGSNLGTATQVKIAPAGTSNSNPPDCTDPSSIILGAGITSYEYAGLSSGTKYGFRVCGFDGTNVTDGAIIWDYTN